jgi:hypothetical protein
MMSMSKPGKGMMDLLTEEEKELLALSGLSDLTTVKPRLGDESSGSGQMSPGGTALTGKRRKR